MRDRLRALVLLREVRELAALLGRFLSAGQKRRLLFVSLWACALSLLEMAVAGAVIPYVQCVGGQCPQAVSRLVGEWPVVPLLSAGLLLLITVKLGVQAYFAWSAAGFHQQVQRDTVSRLLAGYLHLDWSSFQSEHRAHYLRRCFTTTVDAAFAVQQCITLISSTLMLLFLSALMLWQDWRTALALCACFVLLGVMTQRLIGRTQNRFAHEREAAMQRWNIGMAEALASFREIRVYGLERFFLDHLDRSIHGVAHANKRLNFLPALPRMVLDFAILSILLLVVSVWVWMQRPIADLLPQLVFYAVVARALMPAMINVLSTRAALSGSIVNIQLVLQELAWAQSRHTKQIGIRPQPAEQPAFVLEEVGFRHTASQAPVIERAGLRIAHPSWVALTGASGAGKSTLMELLCGIRLPDAGRVVHAWPGQAPPRLAYLPQHVALLDGSVAENVVFGFDAGEPARIDAALKLACVDEVVGRLPGGHQARIGADGARLSGGERQRLALARALYRNPDLLLLDEATSGLDEATETQLLSSIRRARPGMSVVFITHRSGSLRFADRVVHIAAGGVVTEVSPRQRQ